MADRDEFGAFLIGFVVGGLTGAVAALLLAPQTGAETRAMIKEKAIELKDKATETVEDAYDQAEKAAAEARARFDELAQKTKEKAAEFTQKGQVVIEQQREKLSEAIAPKKKETKSAPAKPAA